MNGVEPKRDRASMMLRAMTILAMAALLAATAGVLAPAGPAEAQNFWESEPPRKAKKKKAKAAKPADAKPAPAAPAAATAPAETSALTTTPEVKPDPDAPLADPASAAEDARAAAREAAEAARAAKDAATAAALLEPRVVPTAPRPDADAIVAAAFRKLDDAAFVGKAHKDDVTAAKIFYGERAGPGIWIGSDGFHDKGKAVI
jgi:hypothetical protein